MFDQEKRVKTSSGIAILEIKFPWCYKTPARYGCSFVELRTSILDFLSLKHRKKNSRKPHPFKNLERKWLSQSRHTAAPRTAHRCSRRDNNLDWCMVAADDQIDTATRSSAE